MGLILLKLWKITSGVSRPREQLWLNWRAAFDFWEEQWWLHWNRIRSLMYYWCVRKSSWRNNSETPERESIHIWLPTPIRYASHSLNLLGKTDVEAVVKSRSSTIHNLHVNAMKKVQDLWNICGRRTIATEICDQVIGIQIFFFG